MTGSKAIRLIVTVVAAANAIIEQARYYTNQEGQTLADRWEAAVYSALQRLPRTFARGPRCGFRNPELGNLRRIAVPGFPQHLIFYQDEHEQGFVRVVHILHGARDIEGLLTRQLLP